ncbi:thiol:disulfide interchange protein [Litorimonas cladophorae]|uniref:Thiol:disulfide interchange protein n=1 Tax=Litorimonas cladophorae TaxID=1220491 RepID=A0A918NER9_9PROT|nr:DsbE family thiol:disulfide interchange protein [Litorimonas cladophorae]GGX61774.1 thiol:disulfide interchange protein [Litorimonas cladophorae]
MNLRGLIPLAGFFVLVGFLAFSLTRDPSILPSELIDKPFPEFELANLAETDTLDASLLEGKVSLVNVFGSWCVACTVEHPQLMALKDETDLQLVGVDWRDTRENANRWLVRHGNPYDVVVFDPHSKLIVPLGITGAPETFVVDRSGQIRYKHIGVITPEIWDDTLRPLVESLQAVQ